MPPEKSPMYPDPQNLSQAEEGGVYDAFGDKAIRNRFIQKVYGILTTQFLLTFIICAVFIYTAPIKLYMQQNSWPLITSLVLYLVTGFTLMCCPTLQRSVPHNYILLGVLTGSMSVMLGVVCAFSSLDAVFIAAGITFATTLAVSIFSCWTKFDFTKLIYIAMMCGFALMMAGFFAIFFHSKMMQVVYAGAGAVICVLYLAIDTQLIMGGRRFEISEEDYIFAALNLYLDIVQLFLFILQLLNASDN